jgi:hypothetical protein
LRCDNLPHVPGTTERSAPREIVDRTGRQSGPIAPTPPVGPIPGEGRLRSAVEGCEGELRIVAPRKETIMAAQKTFQIRSRIRAPDIGILAMVILAFIATAVMLFGVLGS